MIDRLRSAGRLACAAAILLSMLCAPLPAMAAGDLLVAPTRIVLDGKRGAEVILNNIGSEEATYRISLELRRMKDNGKLEDVALENASDSERAALDIIRFAPRRVTLPPSQPQSIRIGLQGTEALPDGEYRAHMLFRAIPKTPDATAADTGSEGLKINLVPIYGVTIPVIVRKGDLKATAAIANAKFATDNEGPTLQFDLSRAGTGSVFGEIRITKQGVGEPLMVAKGLAVYPELNARTVSLPITTEQQAKLKGEVTISYYQAPESGGGLLAQLRTVLN
jgi:P pilus assembly chaperone PapD